MAEKFFGFFRDIVASLPLKNLSQENTLSALIISFVFYSIYYLVSKISKVFKKMSGTHVFNIIIDVILSIITAGFMFFLYTAIKNQYVFIFFAFALLCVLFLGIFLCSSNVLHLDKLIIKKKKR